MKLPIADSVLLCLQLQYLLLLLLGCIGTAVGGEGGGGSASAEFAVLTIQSCRWYRPSQPAASADLGDCWKAYSGYPFGCPRRDASWMWDGSFVQPVNLQRVVVSGAPSDSEQYRVAVWAGEPLPGPKSECRLEQSSGRVGIFGCVGSAGLSARAVTVGLLPRQSPCRLRLCGLQAFDTDDRPLNFTDCRASLTPTVPDAAWTATPCWLEQPAAAGGAASAPPGRGLNISDDAAFVDLAPAESPAWTGDFEVPANVGLVHVAACFGAPGDGDAADDAGAAATCQQLEVATVGGGDSNGACSLVAGPDVGAFDCGGRRAFGLAVARQRPLTMPKLSPTKPAVDFELCNVVAYGLGSSSQYMFRG